MTFIGLLGTMLELVSMFLFLIVVFYVYNIRSIAKGINGWNYIAVGYLLIIFRNLFGFLLRNKINLDGETTAIIINVGEPILLLFVTIAFIVGFYKLNKDFEKIRNSKLIKGR